MKSKKILIVGVGFAGLATAINLKKLLKEKADITVIDKNSFHLFVPALIDCLTNKIKKEKIIIDIENSLKKRKINFIKEEVTKISPKNKKIFLKNKELSYDYLVLTPGSETNDHNIKNIDRYAYKFKTLQDVELIKKKLKDIPENGSITVIGGGLTGIQLASHLKNYFNNLSKEVNVSLLESHQHILKKAPRKVIEKIEETLINQKIKIINNSIVFKLEKGKIYLKRGKIINSDLIIWVAGIKISDKTKKFNLELCDNGIFVNKYFQTSNPYIYSLGDCICFKDKKFKKNLMKRAQTAQKQGKLVAKNIANDMFNKKKIPCPIKEIPTIIPLPKRPILHYKKLTIQSRFVILLEKLIRFRHMFFYS